MRKLLFVLLSALLVTVTGCQPAGLPDATVSSSPSASQETVPGTPSMKTAHDGGSSTTDPPASAGQTANASPLSSDIPSTDQTDPTVSTAQTPSSVPQQTKPAGSAGGSTSSAPVSSNPPVTPPSEEKPAAPEPEVSEQPEPSVSQPPETTSPSEPDMEAEYARIIRETVAYAESYTAKGFTFVWDDSLEFSWESGAGWMGTPRVKYEGVDGTIEMLKYHIDKIVKTSTDPGNGIPAHSANYKVMQVTVDGDIAFVVLYG